MWESMDPSTVPLPTPHAGAQRMVLFTLLEEAVWVLGELGAQWSELSQR